jgi:BA14K-like protein
MRWIVFASWLLLTLVWISYSSSAGSGSKVAFIPPALVLIALVFSWLWKRLVVRIAGEFEPSHSHPIWGFALPSRRSVRTGLVAAAVGVCAGAVVGQSTFDTVVSNRSPTRPTKQTNLPLSVQTEAVRSQSFSAEPKTAAVTEPNSTISVRTEAVKTQSFSADMKNQDTSPVTSFENAPAKRAETQISTNGQGSFSQPPCDVSLCERHYRSFRASDCTYQPYGGPRQYCTR